MPQIAVVLRAMYEDARIMLTTLKVDGGMTANSFLMQFQSDLVGVPVIRPKVRPPAKIVLR